MNTKQLAMIRLRMMQGAYSSEKVAEKIAKIADRKIPRSVRELKIMYILKRVEIRS